MTAPLVAEAGRRSQRLERLMHHPRKHQLIEGVGLESSDQLASFLGKNLWHSQQVYLLLSFVFTELVQGTNLYELFTFKKTQGENQFFSYLLIRTSRHTIYSEAVSYHISTLIRIPSTHQLHLHSHFPDFLLLAQCICSLSTMGHAQ